MTQYPIDQLQGHLNDLVQVVEQGEPVEITRQGKRVAVLLSVEEYEQYFEGNDRHEGGDALLMRLFLDFAVAESLKKQTLQPYTTEMSAFAHDLIAGVELDD
jgi:prevent-host-death family protein